MSAMPAHAPRHLWSADAFERMVTTGVFDEKARVELVEGEIVDMSPIGSAHQACVDRLTTLLAPLTVAGRAILRVQGSITLGDLSQPQPDLVLLSPRDDYYAGGHPRPADVLLVIEVADTSLQYDRWTKMPLYARAGLSEAWLVDLNGATVDVGVEPSGDDYERVSYLKPGDTPAPQAFPDITLSVSQVLGLATP